MRELFVGEREGAGEFGGEGRGMGFDSDDGGGGRRAEGGFTWESACWVVDGSLARYSSLLV